MSQINNDHYAPQASENDLETKKYYEDQIVLKGIVNSIREIISCCACFCVDDTLKQCMNSHIICQNCFLNIRKGEHPQCPICRAPLHQDTKKSIIAHRILSELPEECAECNKVMLQKHLTAHKINFCSGRKVACGLAPLGCSWVGKADENESHFNCCPTKVKLSETAVIDSLKDVIERIRGQEQSLNQIFSYFKSSLRMLENHEVQIFECSLIQDNFNENRIIFKSDVFHSNQSRWSITIRFDLPKPYDSDQQENEEYLVENYEEEMVDLENIVYAELDNIDDNMNVLEEDIPTDLSQPFASNEEFFDEPINDEIQIDQSGQPKEFGHISFRMTKENSPGVGRRTFSFMLLQLSVPSKAVKINLRPQINTALFNSYGEKSKWFNQPPMLWSSITCLSELREHNVLSAELAIARKVFE